MTPDKLLAGSQRVSGERLFRSFWMGGFECSCQINSAGARLDMTAALQHDIYAREDYRRLREAGMAAARDGLRWHLIDREGQYDWSSWLPMLEAARETGVQVIWDLCHYGWPDDVDIFSPEFVERFAAFTAAAARLHRERTGEPGVWAPVNEMSFFAWAAGRELMFPYAHGRDGELKRQLTLGGAGGRRGHPGGSAGRALRLSGAADPQRAAALAPVGHRAGAGAAVEPVRSVGHDCRPRVAGIGRE